MFKGWGEHREQDDSCSPSAHRLGAGAGERETERQAGGCSSAKVVSGRCCVNSERQPNVAEDGTLGLLSAFPSVRLHLDPDLSTAPGNK